MLKKEALGVFSANGSNSEDTLLDTVAYPTLGARLSGGEDEAGRQQFLLVELTVFFLLLNRKLH